jgi:uncharacterized membrane protein
VTGTRRRGSVRAAGHRDARDDCTTTLTVWHYGSAMGASAGEVRLRNLEERGALTVVDAITMLWMPGSQEPRVGRLHSRTGAGGRRGAVLGALAGTLVLAPVAGAVAGAGLGALAGRLRHTGIDEEFLEEIERRLTPGTSALLVLSEDADLDAIRPVLERGRSRGDVTLMHAVLRDDASQTLREVLATLPATTPGSPVSGDTAGAQRPIPSTRDDRSGRSPRRKETT